MKHPGAKSVGWALVQAARLHRSRMGDKLADLGLFAGQEQVLQALAATDIMTMGELAGILRVRPPTASKTSRVISSDEVSTCDPRTKATGLYGVLRTERLRTTISSPGSRRQRKTCWLQ